jgi:hypothetical protein
MGSLAGKSIRRGLAAILIDLACSLADGQVKPAFPMRFSQACGTDQSRSVMLSNGGRSARSSTGTRSVSKGPKGGMRPWRTHIGARTTREMKPARVFYSSDRGGSNEACRTTRRARSWGRPGALPHLGHTGPFGQRMPSTCSKALASSWNSGRDRTEIEFSYAPYRRNHYGFVNRIIAKLNPLGAAEHSDAPCCLAVLRGARLAPGEEFRAAACSATARPDGSTQLTLL